MSESHEYQEAKPADEAPSAPKLSEGLKRFMVGLASDVGKLTEFMVDPKKAFEDAGLSEEQQQILQSGDQSRIYAALKDLPLPPPAQAAPPPQMPTVVAALQYQGAAAPGAPQAQLPPYYVLQQPQQQQQPWQMPQQQQQQQQWQMPMQQVPTYQPQIYYVVQWPTWPPR